MFSLLENNVIENAMNEQLTWSDSESFVKVELTEGTNEDDEEYFGEYEARPNLIWTTIATKTFLDLVQLMLPQLGWKFRTKKQMWAIIAKKMDAKGFDFTQTQIENKWKDLYRSYRAHADQVRRGKMRLTSKTQIFTNWPRLFPLSDLSTKKRKFNKDETQSNGESKTQHEINENFNEIFSTVPEDETNQLEKKEEMTSDVKVKKERKSSCDDTVQPSIQSLYENDNKTERAISTSDVALHLIAEELASFRQEKIKLEKEKLELKRKQLEAYKERTTEFSKVGKGFIELLDYLKRKIPDEK